MEHSSNQISVLDRQQLNLFLESAREIEAIRLLSPSQHVEQDQRQKAGRSLRSDLLYLKSAFLMTRNRLIAWLTRAPTHEEQLSQQHAHDAASVVPESAPSSPLFGYRAYQSPVAVENPNAKLTGRAEAPTTK